jgi:hypothetical protein
MSGDTIHLPALDGSNPLGFLAGVGLLNVMARMAPDSRPALAWTTGVVPTAVLTGVTSIEALVAAVLSDRELWRDAIALEFNGEADVKFSAGDLSDYVERCEEANDGGRSRALMSALVAEWSFDGKGAGKPTDLHFTAGQQKFLEMARAVRDGLTGEHVVEAVERWRYDGDLPSLMWDVTDDRNYALSARNPSTQPKPTVPGAEWLGLMGLASVPSFYGRGRTVTTGASGNWKAGSWTWPLWADPLSANAARTMIAMASTGDAHCLSVVGVLRRYQCGIKRSEQGGYGTFTPARIATDARSSAP